MNGKRRFILGVLGPVMLVAGCHAPGARETVRSQQGKTPLGGGLHPRLKMETTLGDVVLELDGEKTPAVALRFLRYAEDKHYDGTIFHRVIKDSLIQGGGYDADMNLRSAVLYTDIPGLWHGEARNRRGSVTMIRPGNVGGAPTVQFLINVADNPRMDNERFHRKFIVFGRVLQGMDVVDRIANVMVQTHPKYAAGLSAVVPVKAVSIKSVRLLGSFDPADLRAAATAGYTAATQDQVAVFVRELETRLGKKIDLSESGLMQIDLVVGTGAPPLPSSSIEFHYRGKLVNGTVFDDTYLTEPAVKKIVGLIPGLREGIVTMLEGGRRILILPPDLAYGEGGIPPLGVPPNATLVFEIELLEVK